ncbi:MAG: hypothetical protein MJZ77_05990 [Bacteroidales bacterium]|nr:hypothetical protein [Bacteroidales bacterium]
MLNIRRRCRDVHFINKAAAKQWLLRQLLSVVSRRGDDGVAGEKTIATGEKSYSKPTVQLLLRDASQRRALPALLLRDTPQDGAMST